MNFAIWSIKNPIPSILLFILLTLAGFYAFEKFRIQDLPDIEFPQLVVSLSLPGATPSQLETEVARKVEDSIASVSGIRHISTSITEGKVAISVFFVLERQISDALIDVKDAVDSVRSELPPDLDPPTVSAERLNGSPLMTYTLEQYKGSMHMLYEGAILAVLVVGLFLRDWRAILISATALPLSIIPTFGIMYGLGFTLNTLTLLALAVVVGILIDDAIVEIENIVRHKRMGKTTLEATKEAVNEIALAVMATTLTIVVVFLPTTMMGGVIGLLFRQFGWTIVISVLMSLAVARLITPLMAAYFLKNDTHIYEEEKDGLFMTKYMGAVKWCLMHKKKTLLIATIFFGLSIVLATKLPAGFLPPSDVGYTTLSIELPPGSLLEETVETAETVRKSVETIEGIENVFAVIGADGQGDDGEGAGDLRKGSLTLTFLPKDQRPSQDVINAEIRRILPDIPGAKFALKNDGPGESFSIALSSENADALTKTALALEKDLRGLKTLSNVNSTASLQRPEISIRPNFARAAELGITAEAIADTVRIATSGDFDPHLSKLNLDNRQLYIRVQMADQAMENMDTISNLRITGHSGQTTLSNIATITTSTGPSQIDRQDRQRYVTVSADLGDAALGQAMDEALALPAIQNRPSSVKLLEMGDAEIMGEMFSGFSLAMLTGIICVFCVLVLLFKDFFQPMTILSAIPLSLGGSIIALLMTGSQMSLPALIGIIMLMGIVTKNSILLVEYTIIGMQERALSRFDAIIDACHKRARPIVMTTVAMIAGMTPIALGMGGDASFRQPMAIAVIGGLITSTILSLLIVPVVFSYVNKLEVFFSNAIKRS